MHITCVADLVEMSACIQFLEHELAIRFQDPRTAAGVPVRGASIVPHCVLSTKYYEDYRVHHLAIFRIITEHPVERLLAIPGTNYRISFIQRLPVSRANHTPLKASNDIHLNVTTAVRAAASLIKENIDPDTESFQDAVDSRLRFITQQSEVQSEVYMSESVARTTRAVLHDEVSEQPSAVNSPATIVRTGAKPFAKPTCLDLDHLAAAFSTHYNCPLSGKGIMICPSLPPLPCVSFQKLVFYHPAKNSSFKFPPPPLPPTKFTPPRSKIWCGRVKNRHQAPA